MDIIEELYLGNLSPGEIHTENMPKYKKAAAVLCKYEDILLKNLKGQDLKMFKKYVYVKNIMTLEENKIIFKNGFKTGAKIIYATFND